MCTVTFIPTNNGVYITSNRDEKHTRLPASVPGKHFVNGYEMLYPVDGDSGGSWIAARNNGDAAVLLNGGFVKHIPLIAYRKSRGLVFIEIISQAEPEKFFRSYDCKGVAPFTIVFYVHRQLIECRWDGAEKHSMILQDELPHIWSSVTLYDPVMIRERENWFHQWVEKTTQIDTETIFRFHRFGGKGDIENDFVINRQNKLFTVSITSLHIQAVKTTMNYFDMKENKAFAGSIDIDRKKSTNGENLLDRSLNMIKRTAIIITNWEYWPFHVVYGPVYLYWIWLSIKARSFFFFSEANPSIENAGFTNERKSAIYAMLPQQYYPKTILCHRGVATEDIIQLLAQRKISYPMIAKPDIGERGIRVKLLHNRSDLDSYLLSANVNFLLQEFISYELEVGIFYYRIPGEKKGKISGIVGKEFLGVTGDGKNTIEKLVKKNNRFFLQLSALRREYGDFLNVVLPDGECLELVPYGNHARGAKFIDLSGRITDQLTASIDRFCQQVPEFYFGRMDIKFRSWEDLCKGNHFSVIELNGAGSEPTHIYDPSHSIIFAWKEIIRHWRLLYIISSMNAKRNGIRFMAAGKGLSMLKAHSAYLKLMAGNNG